MWKLGTGAVMRKQEVWTLPASQKNMEKKSCLCSYRGNRGPTPYHQSATQLFITTKNNKSRDTKTACHQAGEHIELRWSVRLGRGCGGYHTSPESCMARSARRSNQSTLKDINPEYSLEELMLKLKLQYFGHLCEELTHWKRPWCCERLKAGGKGVDKGWDGWMASPTQ